MNNTGKIIFISALAILCSGCNKYFVSTSPDHTFYGAYNRRDFTHADVTVFKKDSSLVCDGSVYLNAPSRSITLKGDRVDAKMKLGCNDGTILDLNWKLKKNSFANGFGEGVDQLNNHYKFQTVSKKEFIKTAGSKVKMTFPNDKKHSYLKY